MTERTHHHRSRPPDVEEALSSMLWTPYERTPTDSSSEDDDEKLNKKLRKSISGYEYLNNVGGVGGGSDNCIGAVSSTSLIGSTVIPSMSTYFSEEATTELVLPATAFTFAVNPATTFVPLSNTNIYSSLVNNNNDNFYYNRYDNRNSTVNNQYRKNHENDATTLPSSSYRFSYPYYGPIPNLKKCVTMIEPPTYESLYSSKLSTTSMRTKAMSSAGFVLNSLSTAISTISGGNRFSCTLDPSTERIGEAPASRMVHSFTDDFKSENSPINVSGEKFSNKILRKTFEQDLHSNHFDSTPTNSQPLHVATTLAGCGVTYSTADSSSSSYVGHQMTLSKENEKSKQTLSKNERRQHKERVNEPVFSDSFHSQHSFSINTNTTEMNNNTTISPLNSPMATMATISHPGENTIRNKSIQKLSQLATPAAAITEEAMVAAVEAPATEIERVSFSSSSAFKVVSSDTVVTFPTNFSRSFNAVGKKQKEKCNNTSSSITTVSDFSPARRTLLSAQCVSTSRSSRSLSPIRKGESFFNESHIRQIRESNMRFNIPANVSAGHLAETVSSKNSSIASTNNSSVFLTTTDSSTSQNNNTNNNYNSNIAILSTNSTLINAVCHQPTLTIQVNNNNNNCNNKNNINSSEGNMGDVTPNGITQLTAADLVVNGISVVNCSYVNNNICNQKNNINNSDTSEILNNINNNNNNNNDLSCGNIFQINNDSYSSVPKKFNIHESNQHQTSKSVNSNSSCCNNDNTIVTETVNIIKVSENIENASFQGLNLATLSSPASPTTSLSPISSQPSSPSRTFTSTECQTDDLPLGGTTATREDGFRQQYDRQQQQPHSQTREQRRRERRERRLQQQQHQQQQQQQHQQQHHHHPHRRTSSERYLHVHPHANIPLSLPSGVPTPTAAVAAAMSTPANAMLRPMLPDILHSHFPPPYNALSLASNTGGPPAPTMLPQSHQSFQPPSHHPPPPATSSLITPIVSTVPIPGATTIVGDGRFTIPLPIIRRSPSERSGKGCCGQWFAGPPLRALIAVVALGGVACALGGAALGATGLAGPPTSHLSAALLMIGVGVVLVTVSGAAWRMTAPGGPPCMGLGSSVDLGRCGRRPCSRGGGAPHGLLYPEFQHRPPPPSYQASMQEYRLRLLLLDRDRQSGVIRGSSPPPTYRSHAGSLLRAPLTTTIRGGVTGSIIDPCSEYSLPPSYRSRNATPAISSDRSIEITQSGRLLANEDIPEPISAQHLPEYNTLQQQQQETKTFTELAKDSAKGSFQVRTSAIVEPMTNFDEKLNPRALTNMTNAMTVSNQLTSCGTATTTTISSTASIVDHSLGATLTTTSATSKDLVTIVTISQEDGTLPSLHSQIGDQMEILAHL